LRTIGFNTYTVFGVYANDTDERYATFVEAATPEDAEKKAVNQAPAEILVAGVVLGKVAPVDQGMDTGLIPLPKRGYETIVATVKVGYKRIRLPLHCPECKVDLRKNEGVKQWDYWDYFWEGRIPRGEYHNDYGVAVNQDRGARTPSGMDSTIVAVVLQCNSCEFLLWNGYTEDEKPKPKKKKKN